MQDDGRLIIEVSCPGYLDYEAVKKRYTRNGELRCIGINGVNKCSVSMGDGDCNFAFVDFIFVNQNDAVTDIIEYIINNTQKTKICIAVHRTGNPIQRVSSGIEKSQNKGKIISSKEFNHEPSDPLWHNGLSPFIVESIGNNFKDYQAKFDSLWNLLAPSPADITHSLRSQILTPFVALHLALQDSFNENGKLKDNPLIFAEECKKCCEDINNQILPDQFKDAKDTHDKLKTEIGKLCKVIEKGNVTDTEQFKKLYEELCTAGKSGNDLIGDFAEMLEGVINRADFKKKIITLRHNIKNLLGTIDPNINALKNADKQAVREEWSIAKEAILTSRIYRVEKEIKLYDEIRGTISKDNDIYEKLMEADKIYKVLFNAFSSNREGDSSDNILKSGGVLIQILKDIIKKLEEMENG